jgi:hypothetical protein
MENLDNVGVTPYFGLIWDLTSEADGQESREDVRVVPRRTGRRPMRLGLWRPHFPNPLRAEFRAVKISLPNPAHSRNSSS